MYMSTIKDNIHIKYIRKKKYFHIKTPKQRRRDRICIHELFNIHKLRCVWHQRVKMNIHELSPRCSRIRDVSLRMCSSQAVVIQQQQQRQRRRRRWESEWGERVRATLSAASWRSRVTPRRPSKPRSRRSPPAGPLSRRRTSYRRWSVGSCR